MVILVKRSIVLVTIAIMCDPHLVYAKRSIAALSESPYSCVEGCKDALGLVAFGDVKPLSDYYTSQCASTYFVTSTAACASAYCPDTWIRHGWQYFTDVCSEEAGLQLLGYEEALVAVPSNVTTVNTLTTDVLVYNETILVNREAWSAGFATEHTWTSEMGHHHAFGWAMYVLLGMIVVAGLIVRLAGSFFRLAPIPRAAQQSPSIWTRIDTLWRKHVSMPLFLHYRNRSRLGWIQIPRRLPALMVMVYMLLNLVFVLIDYKVFDDNLYWRHDLSTQRWRYVADRTGIMAIYNFPLLWLTASRNDMLLWVCGWSFSQVQLFHRAIAFTATVLAIVHSGAYTWIERDYLAISWKEEYWYCGAIAMISMSFLLPLSTRKLREVAYEVFLIIHIALAVMTLVAMFYHVKIMEGTYNAYLWVCIGLWSTERLVRIARILFFSWQSLVKHNGLVSLEDVGDGGQSIHLVVQTLISYHPKPGQYYFLYFPTSWSPWENHPFTLAGVTTNVETGCTELHFLAKVHRGATQRLARRARKAGGDMQLKVWLEGPYGHTAPLDKYENVMMVTGGSGITTALPYLQHMHELSVLHQQHCPVRSVRLIWVVRTRAFAEQILARYPAFLLKNTELPLDISIYVTEASSESETQGISETNYIKYEEAQAATTREESKCDDHSVSALWGSNTINWHQGRPEMLAVLDDTVGEIQYRGGRLGLLTCGPRGMMDDIREALLRRYGLGQQDLWGSEADLYEEGFTW